MEPTYRSALLSGSGCILRSSAVVGTFYQVTRDRLCCAQRSSTPTAGTRGPPSTSNPADSSVWSNSLPQDRKDAQEGPLASLHDRAHWSCHSLKADAHTCSGTLSHRGSSHQLTDSLVLHTFVSRYLVQRSGKPGVELANRPHLPLPRKGPQCNNNSRTWLTPGWNSRSEEHSSPSHLGSRDTRSAKPSTKVQNGKGVRASDPPRPGPLPHVNMHSKTPHNTGLTKANVPCYLSYCPPERPKQHCEY